MYVDRCPLYSISLRAAQIRIAELIGGNRKLECRKANSTPFRHALFPLSSYSPSLRASPDQATLSCLSFYHSRSCLPVPPLHLAIYFYYFFLSLLLLLPLVPTHHFLPSQCAIPFILWSYNYSTIKTSQCSSVQAHSQLLHIISLVILSYLILSYFFLCFILYIIGFLVEQSTALTKSEGTGSLFKKSEKSVLFQGHLLLQSQYLIKHN